MSDNSSDLAIDVLYFASLREAIGHDRERIVLPKSIFSIEELRLLLEENHGTSLKKETFHVAVDQHLVAESYTFSGGEEVAFFPDVTGG